MIKFILQTLLITITLSLGAMGFGYVVDPYDYWGSQKISGWNFLKPKAAKHLIEVKLRQYVRSLPQLVIIGNSRVAVGFDPDLLENAGKVRGYNFGMPGVHISKSLAALENILPKHKPKNIYIGIDYLDYRVDVSQWQQPSAMSESTTYSSPSGWQMFTETRASIDMLLDSATTIWVNKQDKPESMYENGLMPMNWIEPDIQMQGAIATNETVLTTARTSLLAGQKPKRIFWPVVGQNPIRLATLASIARLKTQGVNIVLFTYPYHVSLLAMHTDIGARQEQAAFTAQLQRDATKLGVLLVDFDVPSPITREPVPGKHSIRQSMHWYWESAHFKPVVGTLIVDCIKSPQVEKNAACQKLRARRLN